VDSIRRFRNVALGCGLLLSVAAAAGACVFSPALGQGLLCGGIASVLAFWLLLRQTERLAGAPNAKAHAAIYVWTPLRLLLYGAVLIAGYRLDPESLHGLLGAAIGLFITQGVVLVLGLAWSGPKISPDQDEQPR
jgi:hypothetical protein